MMEPGSALTPPARPTPLEEVLTLGSYRSFKYRLYPTVAQTQRLERLLAVQCELYNAALEERIGAWKWERRSVTKYDQFHQLSDLRALRPDALEFGVVVCRGTLSRLDLAFTGFFRRVKAGQTPGFPRFKSQHRWDSISWPDVQSWRVDHSGRFHVQGIGGIGIKIHRPLQGVPKSAMLKREGPRWFAVVRCADVPADPSPATGRKVGIDLGVASLVTTSDGEHIDNPRLGRRAADRLAYAQRDLTPKKRGSNRRRKAVERVAGQHRKVTRCRRDNLHKISRTLVNNHDLIVHEDLKIANMVRRPEPRPVGDGTFEPNGATAKAGLNLSIYDAGWGDLLRMIAYKAEDAGREVIAVNPRNTSRRCAECGHTAKGNRPSQAVFLCLACGHSAHADVNAARNILRAGLAQREAQRADREAQELMGVFCLDAAYATA